MAKAMQKSESGKGSQGAKIGHWAFLIGLILAVIVGIFSLGQYQAIALVVVFLLGIIVGLLNITASEVSAFLTSGAILVIVSYLGGQVISQAAADSLPWLVGILNSILTLFVPATIIVALKAVFALAKD